MKSIKLVKPCKEDWSNMTKKEKDRFCSLCSKTVVDYSQLSKEEIIKKLNSAKGEICARVTQKQIDTPLIEIKQSDQWSIPFSKYAAGVLLASSILTTQACNSIDVTPPIHVEEGNNSKANFTSVSQPQKTTNNPIQKINFKGTILSEKTNQPLENANVTFVTLEDTYTTVTDVNGVFNLKLSREIIKEKNVVVFSFENIFDEYVSNSEGRSFAIESHYQAEDFVLSKKEINESFVFKAQEQTFLLGGIGLHENKEKTNPIIIVNGQEIQYEEFQKARLGKKSTCNLAHKDYLYFESESAIALYGEAAKDGLYLFTDKKN